jgi:hypothetical protein
MLAPRKHQEILFLVGRDLENNENFYFSLKQRKHLYTRGFFLWNAAKAACGEWEKCAWAQGFDTVNSPPPIASESLQEVGAPPK